ncbi:Os08g0249900 [Oryza sativa Japonica Group]|uniref:Os08g0249900 protein n=1 Tax=Oryza sativa subsp. japonica TaxID=39947 RepID=A0A0P0XE27_ORYSJ|nr:Os08g0249900 [Oryza sativa Japonica Group]
MGGLSMDQAFVQAPEHRAKPSVAEADGIPVIDLSPLFAADGVDVDALAAEVGRASQDWGFFVVVRHGVPEEVVARAAEAQRAFFALPPARRAAVARSEAAQMGYYASDHTQNVRDWKEAFDLVPTRHPPPPPPAGVLDNKWPDDLPGFRSFGSLTSSSSSRRLVPHQILEQRSNGGVWSNDRYESAEHRVAMNVEKERFSMPFFFYPASYTMVEPLEEIVSEESPARYNPYCWGEFFSTRKNGDFKKLDVDNIQIAHFRKKALVHIQ